MCHNSEHVPRLAGVALRPSFAWTPRLAWPSRPDGPGSVHMDAWQTAVQFLLIDDRAQVLADAHPLTEDGQCGRCTRPGCTAAALAAEALALLRVWDRR
ncbi:MAG: hypothetical protein QOC83_7122 [Pseudonocardiales bacterium]|jgi:hypothetical protein|nr:hypothetical protein [Pseudonocardia sp.]MDT7642834.1 hypothetical protein [Pseudonocardiales bacterium]